jgi:hypothetical protein
MSSNERLRSFDKDDDRVVENAIEHRHGEHAVAGEGTVPTAEGVAKLGSSSRVRNAAPRNRRHRASRGPGRL